MVDFDKITNDLIEAGCFEFRSPVDGKWRKVKPQKQSAKQADLAPHLKGVPGSKERIDALTQHYATTQEGDSPFATDMTDQLLHLCNKSPKFAELFDN